MALKAITGIYGIAAPGGTVATPQSVNLSAYVEAGNVAALEKFTGYAGGYNCTDGCRILLTNVPGRVGYITNLSVASVVSALA